jgi:CDGSH-type Zn-finger protein
VYAAALTSIMSKITVTVNGPYLVQGAIPLEGAFAPVKYTAAESTTVYFCGCKATANQPLCDGSPKKAV